MERCSSYRIAVQALFLMGTFQHNTRRHMESYQTHYLTVKAVYESGIHAPITFKNYKVQKRRVLARLWLAIVNHDR